MARRSMAPSKACGLPLAAVSQIRSLMSFQSFRSVWMGPRTVQAVPPLLEHRSTLIFLHGLGDTSDGVEPLAEYLQPFLQHTKFILPTAPVRKVTSRGGMRLFSWFDTVGTDRLDGPQDMEGLRGSMGFIEELIEGEAHQGLPSHRVAVGGISQGGALALAMLRSPLRLGAVAALATYLPLSRQPPLVSAANLATPVLVGHGRHDDVAEVEQARASVKRLRAAGATGVEYREYGGMGHSLLHSRPLEDLRDFLKWPLG